MTSVDLYDIQGLVARGYGKLKAACYLLLGLRDPVAARTWLEGLVDSGEVLSARDRQRDQAVHLAFTPAGLRTLGLPEEVLGLFSSEFRTGMTTPHRQRILGDKGDSAPEQWIWGGPANPPIHGLLMLFAIDWVTLAALYDRHARGMAAAGIDELKRLDTFDLGGIEHFGFRDGVSQPKIEGFGPGAAGAATIRAGEVVLGYRNEYGLYTDGPTLPRSADPHGLLPEDASGASDVDLGRNGTYLVFRQLRQDVPRFWAFIAAATRGWEGGDTARIALAAKMVGRWPSGAPLVRTPERDNPAFAAANDFDYQRDPPGYLCPIGSHIRRANPRGSLETEQESQAATRRHRLLRRGREYGTPPSEDELRDPGGPLAQAQDRGLHFICLNPNISRQFEFVQHAWINNPKFNGGYDEVDPLIAVHDANTDSYTMPAQPIRRRIASLPNFVSTRGGAYFFLPGIRAIRYLARMELS